MGNDNHDERGRFASGSSSGAASGDHQKVSPSLETRNVPGHGNVPRSKVIAKHNNAPSVGTSFAVRLKPKQTTTGLGQAARERVALNERVDEGHYPKQTDADVGLKTTLGKPGKHSPGWPYNN